MALFIYSFVKNEPNKIYIKLRLLVSLLRGDGRFDVIPSRGILLQGVV